MFGRLKEKKLSLKPQLFLIHWYRSSRSCSNPDQRRVKPEQMPPLMVRKPEWRR
jgi:hypothetical protein